MWKKVKGWLGLAKPWQRWDERKQQQVQAYLEQKVSGTHTLDDWTLAAESIIHRYAPNRMALSQEDYENFKAQIRAKIEKNLANPPDRPIKPEKISHQDARQIVAAALSRMDMLPDSLKQQPEFWQDLLDVCSKPWSLSQQSSFLFDRYADHNFDTDEVAQIAGATLTLYQELLSAYQRGDLYAIGCSAVNACPVCQRDIRNRKYKIVDLLAAYRDPSTAQAPVIPYHQCNHVNADGGGYCRCSWRIESRRPDGMSLEYWTWLNQTLKDAGLPSNPDLE